MPKAMARMPLTTNVHHRCVARSRNMGTSTFRPSLGD
jgi:hypothetical protein